MDNGFDVTNLQCASGYDGNNPTVTKCTTDGGAYTVSGCTKIPYCVRPSPSNSIGYDFSHIIETSLRLDGNTFDVTNLQCASGYEGNNPTVTKCTNDGDPYIVSGCTIPSPPCQWNSPEGCKRCQHNLYLHDGTCVSTCPDGFKEQRPLSYRQLSCQNAIGRSCMAIISDYAVKKVWGDSSNGGSDPGLTSGVVTIFSNWYAFAALKSDGSVKAWGDSSNGGTDPGLTNGVVTIFSNTI